MSKATQLAFNGGEFTEFMDSRVDVAKYGKGCRTLENMNVLPYGAATARSGTKFGGEIHDSTIPTRLIPFVFSDTTTFHIELSKDSIRFWKDGELVESSPGVEYVVNSDPLIGGIIQEYSDVWLIQFEQVNDVVFFTAPNQPLKKLVRYADDNWAVELEEFNTESIERYPPMGSYNYHTSKSVTLNSKGDNVNEIATMTATGFTFEEFADIANDHSLQEVFEMSLRQSTELRMTVANIGNITEVFCDGAWSLTTEGTGRFTMVIEESSDGGLNFKRISTVVVDGTERNYTKTGTTNKPSFIRVEITNINNTGSAIRLSRDSYFHVGKILINEYVSPTQVKGLMLFPIPIQYNGTPIRRFKRQEYNATSGYPTSVALHKNRLCIARSDVHLSASGGYNDFHETSLSDASFTIPLTKSGSPLVRWMKDLRELRIGMTSDEVVITSENVAEGFSYKNYNARFDSSYGSLPIKPETVNGSLLFVTNDAEALRNQVISGMENYYDANTLTTLADHILQTGVVQTGFQRQPYPTYYAVREDGQLASLLYEEAQQIMAWSRHVTDGKYKSLSVVPRPRGEDEVAYIVERVIDGVIKQYVEFRVPDMSKTLRDELYSDMWYVDCGIEVTGTAMATVTGLDHLEGKSVAVLADGIKQTNKTVVAGEITLDAPADKVIVGLPYSYTLEPMMLNSAEVMGQSKQIGAAIVYLWRSGEGFVSVNGGLESRLKTDTDFTGAGLHDGSSGKINVDADWSRETSLTLRGESPLPLNVQSITLEFAIGRK